MCDLKASKITEYEFEYCHLFHRRSKLTQCLAFSTEKYSFFAMNILLSYFVLVYSFLADENSIYAIAIAEYFIVLRTFDHSVAFLTVQILFVLKWIHTWQSEMWEIRKEIVILLVFVLVINVSTQFKNVSLRYRFLCKHIIEENNFRGHFVSYLEESVVSHRNSIANVSNKLEISHKTRSCI